MYLKMKQVAAAALAGALTASCAYAGAPQTKKHAVTRKSKPSQPSVTEQIEQLRHALDDQSGRIDSLSNALAAKDAELKQARQEAAEAKATAVRSEQAADAQRLAVGANNEAVSALQSTVSGLKASQTSLTESVSAESAKIKKAVENPTALHYKGITLTPVGFLAGETSYRTHGTTGDMGTPFSALPYEHSDAYSLSEFFGSARQSRIGLMAEGKVSWGTVRGYMEADFLGSGATSNNNESDSYVLRQRLLYAQAETNSHWSFIAGQTWSLATAGKKGVPVAVADIDAPLTIDPDFLPGFIWARQYGFRVTKSFPKAAFAVAAENPQVLYSASLAGNTPYAVLGGQGVSAGFMNAAVSSCAATTALVNYTNQAGTQNGATTNQAVPVYKTLTACTNLSNLSFNQAPDLIVKAGFDPGWGHYEVFGIGRFAHETVYPGETNNANLYGGYKDIVTGAVIVAAPTATGSYSNSIQLGGVGGSLRVPVMPKNALIFDARGLYGAGVGRYAATLLPDVTANAGGQLVPLHNLSGMIALEASPTPRLVLVAQYGGDYVGRAYYSGGTTLPTPTAAQTAAGVWGAHWGAPTAAAVGYGSRLLSNSACQTNANPGYNGASTGFYPGACGAQTRNAQEITGGYWYDIYKGDRGRLRQGVQYGYVVREAWSGADGLGAKGIDNMVFTTFRYYLP